MPAPPSQSPKQLFRRRCYLLGITDPATVAELWVEEQKKAKKQRTTNGQRRKQPRRPRQQ